MADLIDVGGTRIERPVGDAWGRVPHFVVDRDEWAAGEQVGVLYWPTPKGWWSAQAFSDLDAAAGFVDKLVEGCDG